MAVTFLKSLTRHEDLPRGNKPHVAIMGRSNVGKSSLINHLTGQKSLANVSVKPGRTQTINLFEVDKRYFLVDLPGYGFAKAPKAVRTDFQEMIGNYLTETDELRLVLLIIDASIPPTDIDRDMYVYLQTTDIPMVIIMNKVDKLTKPQVAKLGETFAAHYPHVPYIAHSVLQAKGRGEIWDTIERAMRAPASE